MQTNLNQQAVKFRAVQVPNGRQNSPCCVSRPFGTDPLIALVPNVETLGYFRLSLRDRILHPHKCSFARSNPSGIDRGRSHSVILAKLPHVGCYDLDRSRLKALFAVMVWVGLGFATAGAERTIQTEANVMAEVSFTASRTHADPFNEVKLDVIFIDP